jgi:hypothetical protein
MPDTNDLEHLERRLRQARDVALSALEAEDASDDSLIDAAAYLGSALHDAAEADGLWARHDDLSLSDWQRVQLKITAEADWEWLLRARGYERTWDAQPLARASKEVLSGALPTDVETTRAELRELADLLTKDTAVGRALAKPSVAKRRVKAGIRVAGGLAIVAGVGAAFYAAPFLPAFLLAKSLGGAAVGGVFQDGATKLVSKTIKRAMGEERGKVPPMEQVASRLLSTLTQDLLRHLNDAWSSDLELRERLPNEPLDAEPLVRRTRDILERLLTATQLVREAGLGARWAGEQLRSLLDEVGERVLQARKLLVSGVTQARALMKTVAELVQSVPELQRAFDAAVSNA